jgi:NADH:ubiquinone oxidoreductase subunit 4 (subunit M)
MALAVPGIVLVVSLVVFAMFDRNQDGLQFVDRFRWIQVSAGFEVSTSSVCGLSLTMVILRRSSCGLGADLVER